MQRERGGWWWLWGRAKALAHLDLSLNRIGAEGAGRLAGMQVESKSLAHLDLSSNGIGAEEMGRLAVVLGSTKSVCGRWCSKPYTA